jgi:hypothetical protein
LSFKQNKSRAPIRPVSSLSNIPASVHPKVRNKDAITKGFIILSITLVISGLSIWGNLADTIQEFMVGSQLTHDHHDSEITKELFHYLYNVLILGLLITFTWFLFRNPFFKDMRLVQSLIVVALIIQSWNFIVVDSAEIEQYLYVVTGCISCLDRLNSDTHLSPLHFIYDLIVFLSLIVGYMVYFYQSSPYARYKEISTSLREKSS